MGTLSVREKSSQRSLEKTKRKLYRSLVVRCSRGVFGRVRRRLLWRRLLYAIIASSVLAVIFFKIVRFNMPLGVAAVTATGNEVTFSFQNEISFAEATSFLEKVAIETAAFERRLVLLNDTMVIRKSSARELTVAVTFPFVQSYDVVLHLLSVKPELSPPYRVGKIRTLASWRLPMHQTDFSDTNYSQLRCHGSSVVDRWCEMRNVGYIKAMWVFSFPMFYEFPSFFMAMGSRAPPFDVRSDRLMHEPVVTHELIHEYPDLVVEKNVSYVFGRFFNSMMLWHILFDFIVPAYHAIMKVEGTFDNPHRKVYFRDTQEKVFPELLLILTNNQFVNLMDNPTPLFFHRVIVGLPKFGRNSYGNETLLDMARFRYNYTNTTAVGLRDVYLRAFAVTETEPNLLRPKVVFISRQGSHRNILNEDRIVQIMQQTCPFCQIQRESFRGYSLQAQVSKIADASAIVGLHGSGLSHVLWMKGCTENFTSVLLEILPYKYWCRDWYHSAADVAGVHYMSVMNTGRILPVINPSEKSQVQWCWRRKERCEDMLCHDLLKEASFTLEEDTFIKTWMDVVRILERNRLTASV